MATSQVVQSYPSHTRRCRFLLESQLNCKRQRLVLPLQRKLQRLGDTPRPSCYPLRSMWGIVSMGYRAVWDFCGGFRLQSKVSFPPYLVEPYTLTRLCSFKMGNDPDRLPCGKFLENKRYTLFVHGDWPHDKTRGHAVTSRKVRAIFPSPFDLLSGGVDGRRRVSVHPARGG